MDFLSKEVGRRCFILTSDKNEKDHKNLRSKLNQSIIARNRTIIKQRRLETRNQQNGSRSTNHKPWPFELVQVNNFLRGPLRWLTERKNPKYTKLTARYNEFRYKSRVDVLLFVLPKQIEQRSNGSQVNIQWNVGEGKLMMTNADNKCHTWPFLVCFYSICFFVYGI